MNWLKKLWQGFKNLFGQDDGLNPSPVPTPVEPSVPTEPTKPVGKYGTIDLLQNGDHGIDISHHNPSVDLAKFKEGQKFVIMKATEGKDFVSKVYHERMDKAIALGINCGSYHYYKSNVNWKVQADHFLKHYKGTIAPVLDVEGIGNLDYSATKHTPDVLKILRYFKEKTGLTPILYAGYYFTRDSIKPTQEFAEFLLWLPWYTKNFSLVKCPAPWTKINIWQYSETENISGVGKCDANIFLGL